MSRNSLKVLLFLFGLFLNSSAFAKDISLVKAFPNLEFELAVFLTNSADATNRIFVVERAGRILVFPNDPEVTSPEVFLDIEDRVDHSQSFEKGLLGLAFHPDYMNNGFFYVTYTAGPDSLLRSVLSRFSVNPNNPNDSDPESELILLEIFNPTLVHFGGMLEFGKEGYLYISRGDGGSAYIAEVSDAQDLTNLRGTILRIDIDNPSGIKNYGIPPDNPLIGNTEGYMEEIWAWGLRNPWRFSIDSETGLMWGADVGEASYEEVNIIEKDRNYGWNLMEGFHCQDADTCDTTGLTMPIVEYGRTMGLGCAITGGYVYRGNDIPILKGAYVYGDWCSGNIWMLRYEDSQIVADSLLMESLVSISSFGVDEKLELYVIDFWGGSIFRFTDSSTTSLISKYTLLQNYPNPFNSVTKIRFFTPIEGRVTLIVYDLRGREVVRLLDEFEPSGHHWVFWNASNIPSGIYFYQLVAGDFVQTRKMVLLK